MLSRRLRGRLATRLRPTARGWQLILAGLIIFFAARALGTTQLYQLAYALLALLPVAFALGLAGSRNMGFSRSLPEGRAIAGREVRLSLRFTSRSPLLGSEAEVIDRVPEPRRLDMSPSGRDGHRSAEVKTAFARRGVYRLGPAEVGFTDPFGLLRFTRRFDDTPEIIAYPAVCDIISFPLPGGASETGGSGRAARRGEEFAGLREYRRGDESRHIHWKSLARTGELFVREFELQSPRRHSVMLDMRRSDPGVSGQEVEDAVTVAGSMLRYLLKEGLPFRLLCADREGSATGFGEGETCYWRAMRLLAAVRADGDEKVAEFLNRALEEKKESLGDGAIIVARVGASGLESRDDRDLAACVGRLRLAGVPVSIVALATHTYRPGQSFGSLRRSEETWFSREQRRLEEAGAEVLVVRHPEGVAGLAGSYARRTGA